MKKNVCKLLAYCALLSVLSSCGGGGGGGGVPPPQSTLSFDVKEIRDSISTKLYSQYKINITLNKIPDNQVYVVIQDTAGLFSGQNAVSIAANSLTSYTANLVPNKTPGHYSGNLQVNLCFDLACSSKFGEASTLSYDINVLGEDASKTLGATSGFSWIGFQADANHTGYAPITVDASNTKLRWILQNPKSPSSARTERISLNAAENSMLYVQLNELIVALNEDDGSHKWEFNPGYTLNPYKYNVIVTGSNLVASLSGGSDASDEFKLNDIVAIDKATGGRIYNIDVYGVGNSYPYSLVADVSRFYVSGSPDSTNYLDASIATGVAGSPKSAVANLYSIPVFVGDNLIYNTADMSSQALVSVSTITGESSVIVTNAGVYNSSVSDLLTPMKVSNQNIIAISSISQFGDNYLTSFDPVANLKKWSIPGVYVTNPAFANNILYVANNENLALEARNPEDGKLLWSWVPTSKNETAFVGNLVVTDSHIFVTTTTHLYAINLATKKIDFSFYYQVPLNDGIARLLLSPSKILYLSTGSNVDYSYNNNLIAFDLN